MIFSVKKCIKRYMYRCCVDLIGNFMTHQLPCFFTSPENLFLKQEHLNTRTTCTFGLFLWHKKVVLVFKCSFLRTNSLVKQRNKVAGGSENFPLLKVAAHFKALVPIFKILSGIQTEKSHEFLSLIYLMNQATQL